MTPDAPPTAAKPADMPAPKQPESGLLAAKRRAIERFEDET
jgi:hypothetical protein